MALVEVVKVPPAVSLPVIAGILALAVVASLARARRLAAREEPART
jgi:hypothetical protein